MNDKYKEAATKALVELYAKFMVDLHAFGKAGFKIDKDSVTYIAPEKGQEDERAAEDAQRLRDAWEGYDD